MSVIQQPSFLDRKIAEIKIVVTLPFTAAAKINAVVEKLEWENLSMSTPNPESRKLIRKGVFFVNDCVDYHGRISDVFGRQFDLDVFHLQLLLASF
jgi:hypothetical protein